MESGWYIWNLKSKWLVGVLFGILFSCNTVQEPTPNIKAYQLQSGDMVCRLGNGFFSNYFRKYASSAQKYSHIGIVEVTADSIFVIHTEASELTGIGYAKREPIQQFLRGITTFGFYRLQCNAQIRQRLLEKSKNYYQNKTPFDMDFNSEDDAKLYCTELVAKSLNYALDSVWIQPKLKLGSNYFYGLDDICQQPMVISLMEN